MSLLSQKPNVVIYVRRDNLVIAGRHVAPAKLGFPADIVSNMELLDRRKFISGCKEFFIKKGLKGKRPLIVLDESIVFSKSVELDRSIKQSDIAADYIDAIPLATSVRACIQIRQGNNLTLYATNSDIYLCLLQALEIAGANKATAIAPAAAYDVPADAKLAVALDAFSSDIEVARRNDFADCRPV